MYYTTETTLNKEYFERHKNEYTRSRKIRRMIIMPSTLFIFAIFYAITGYLFSNYAIIAGAVFLLAVSTIVFLNERIRIKRFPVTMVDDLAQKLKDKKRTENEVTIKTVFEDTKLTVSSELMEEEVISYKKIYNAKINNNALIINIDEHKRLICEGLKDEEMQEIVNTIKKRNRTKK